MRAPPHTMQGTSKALRTRGNCRGDIRVSSVGWAQAGARDCSDTATSLSSRAHRYLLGPCPGRQLLHLQRPWSVRYVQDSGFAARRSGRSVTRGRRSRGAGEQDGGGCHSQTLTALTTQSGSLPGPPPASRCRTRPVRTPPAAQQRPDPHPPSHPGAVAGCLPALPRHRAGGWQRVDSDRAQAVFCPERTPTTAAQPPYLPYRHERPARRPLQPDGSPVGARATSARNGSPASLTLPA